MAAAGTMTGRALEYDLREGGRYRFELTYGQAAPAGTGKTTAQTDVSQGRFAGEMVLTWELEPQADETRVTVIAANVPPGISKADHDAGLRATLDNLARFCVWPPTAVHR